MKNENTYIRAILLRPDHSPVEMEVINELKPIQDIVGGHFDVLHYRDNMILVFNEEGKQLQMQPNLFLNTNRMFFDVIAGPVLVVGTAPPEMISLTDAQVKFCMEDLADHCVVFDQWADQW